MNSSVRLGRRHLRVELLERLGRVAVLAEEHPQQVLGLEGGDRRLDAVAGDVADDRGEPGRRHPEHVVEVAGHEPGAGLVDPADLEARRSRAGPRGPAGRPSACGASSSWLSTSSARRSSVVRSSARRASRAKSRPNTTDSADRHEDEQEQQAGDALAPRPAHAGGRHGQHAVEARWCAGPCGTPSGPARSRRHRRRARSRPASRRRERRRVERPQTRAATQRGDRNEGQDRLSCAAPMRTAAARPRVPTVTELSLTAPADPQLDRRGAEVEGLAELALEVAQVGARAARGWRTA